MFSDSDWCLMIVNDRKITTDWKLCLTTKENVQHGDWYVVMVNVFLWQQCPIMLDNVYIKRWCCYY